MSVTLGEFGQRFSLTLSAPYDQVKVLQIQIRKDGGLALTLGGSVALAQSLESGHFLALEEQLTQRLSCPYCECVWRYDEAPADGATQALSWWPWLIRGLHRLDHLASTTLKLMPISVLSADCIGIELPPRGDLFFGTDRLSGVTAYFQQKTGLSLKLETRLQTEVELTQQASVWHQPIQPSPSEGVGHAATPFPLSASAGAGERSPEGRPQSQEAVGLPGQPFSPEAVWMDKPAPVVSASKPSGHQRMRNRRSLTHHEGQIWGKWNPHLQPIQLNALHPETGLAEFVGYMVSWESRLISNKQRVMLKFAVQSDEGAVQCVAFVKPEEADLIHAHYKAQGYAAFQAEVSYDGTYAHDLQAKLLGIAKAPLPAQRQDQAIEKRVELHCHSNMSAKDALSSPGDIVRLAAQFGHPAVALTDHGVVQGFPEAFEAAKACAKAGKPIKLILGMEGYLIPDTDLNGPTKGEPIVYGLHLPRGEKTQTDEAQREEPLLQFVAFDTETTGLDPQTDRIIEIAAARYARQSLEDPFRVVEQFQVYVNPGVLLKPETTQLTGITQETLEQQGIEPLEAVKQFLDFVQADLVCAHNAPFDLAFVRHEGFRVAQINDPHLKFNPIVVDTLQLSRVLWPTCGRYRLNQVCEYLGLNLQHHHRALDDALACGAIFARALTREPDLTLSELNRRAGVLTPAEVVDHERKAHHIILLAENELGLYHLYRLVSASHTQYFKRRPRIPKSLLQYFRQGLIVGAACEAGEVFRNLRQLYDEKNRQVEAVKATLKQPFWKQLARFYDYLEIQPLTNNGYLTELEQNPYREADLIALNRLIIEWGRLTKRPVVATCDAHYLSREQGIFRQIVMTDIGFSPTEKKPDLFFRTTEEMLSEFSYLDPAVAYDLCVTQPNQIANRIKSQLKPFPEGTFPPLIESAADEVRQLTWQTAEQLYAFKGQLPELVTQRVNRELASIIDNGFAIMYYIAHKLVKKSNEDGYIVGSRGSVGSSLVATFCGITEVNPLPPHYRCPHCQYSEFDETGQYGSGFDLPAKTCPHCQTPLIREGQDIPFETFLGFNGDKQPDIDLNFSGEYQPRAHRYIQEMFGESHTFRAGTIGSYAEKNALSVVRKYLDKVAKTTNLADQKRLAQGLVGVKRTTGQHPGGIVVIPKEREVYDFTPIQYPADKLDSVMTTTHFDFNAMHDTILKLDILGHDDPTMLKVLSDMTGQNVLEIPIPDEKVMALFTTTTPLGIQPEDCPAQSATLGLPEMGTFMARGMIQETQPTRFYDLVQLMGLSHGTDVWKGNAQDLIRNQTCTIQEVIGCRDSIMTTLIYAGLPPKSAFDIMEKVRKGKGLSEEHEALMHKHEVPDWYIDSCKKIKYMFPKAHAVAYAISSLRIAWFKVYHPEEYYCAYFTVRADEFDSSILCQGYEHLLKEKKRLYQAFREQGAKDKDQKLYYIAELVEEMYLRGIQLLPLDLYASDATYFRKEAPGLIRPPLNAIPSVSTAMAQQIVAARQAGPFRSQADLMKRSGIGPAALGLLKAAGCLEDLPETQQIDLFSFSA